MEHINYNDLVHVDNRSEAREAVRRLLEVARGGAKELPSCQQVFPPSSLYSLANVISRCSE